MVVHASGKNRGGLGQAMHTNFKLGIEGEYLGLYSPELPRRVVDEIAPHLPLELDFLHEAQNLERCRRLFAAMSKRSPVL